MFLAIPFFLLELYLSLKMGESIGFFGSVLWIVISAMLGMGMLKNSPMTIMGNMQAVQRGKLDVRKFQDASMSYFVGSILLIIPGVLSDFLGLFALAYATYLQFIAKITPEQTNFNQTKGDNDVIDVEIIEEHTHR
jgi:UPF0716 family protein affecting phage T7 exclusion